MKLFALAISGLVACSHAHAPLKAGPPLGTIPGCTEPSHGGDSCTVAPLEVQGVGLHTEHAAFQSSGGWCELHVARGGTRKEFSFKHHPEQKGTLLGADRCPELDAHAGSDTIVVTRHEDGRQLFAFRISTLEKVFEAK